MDNIIPNLYLGSDWAFSDKARLQKYNITHILVVGNGLTKHFQDKFTYHHVCIEDVIWADLISHFPACFQFINEGINSGGVLVHCAAGISRSSTVVIAYLMAQNSWSFKKEAFHHTKDFTLDFENKELQEFLQELNAKAEQAQKRKEAYQKKAEQRMAKKKKYILNGEVTEIDANSNSEDKSLP